MSNKIKQPSIRVPLPVSPIGDFLQPKTKPFTGSSKGVSKTQDDLITRVPDIIRTSMSKRDHPNDPNQLYEACTHLVRSSGLHKAYVSAMSSLPITDLIIKPLSKSSDAVRKAVASKKGMELTSANEPTTISWRRRVNKHWKLKRVNQRTAHSFWTYSTAVVVLNFPFTKMMKCLKCMKKVRALDADWRVSLQSFTLKCKECGHEGRPEVSDRWLIGVPDDVRVGVLDMRRVYAVHNEHSDTVQLYYRVSNTIIDMLRRKPIQKELICETPQSVIDAVHNSKYSAFALGLGSDKTPCVKLRKEKYFILHGDSESRLANGLASPSLTASLDEYWLLRLLQRAQEAFATDFIIPKRFIYPDVSRTSGNLFEQINVQMFMDTLHQQLEEHKKDENYVGVTPFPLGYQALSGEGKSLNLSQEIRVISETILASCGAPLELVFGGMSYNAGNVSIKQQEQRFRGLREDLLEMNQWAIRAVAIQANIPEVVVEHKTFRMGDDMQQINMLMSAQGSNMVSLKSVHDVLGKDSETERAQILAEQDWYSLITMAKSKADLKLSEEQTLRGMVAQAKGQVAGTSSMIEAKRKLAKAVRADRDMMNYVMSHGSLATDIFGEMSRELGGAPPENPRQINPNALAPGAANYGSSSEGTAQAINQYQDRKAGGDRQDILTKLIKSFAESPASDWSGRLKSIEAMYGPEMMREVMSKIAKAQLLANQRPEQLPSRRIVGQL